MTCRVSVAILIVAAMLSASSAQTRDETLHFAFMRTVASGELLLEQWSTVPDDQIDECIEAAKTLMSLIRQFSEDDEAEIDIAFENRIGFLRYQGLDPAIDSILQNHSKIIETLKGIQFPRTKRPLRRLSFGQIASRKLNAFWKLNVLAALHSAAQGDFNQASAVLAGGFAASRWWQCADSHATLLRALVLEERLQSGLVDMQAIGGANSRQGHLEITRRDAFS